MSLVPALVVLSFFALSGAIVIGERALELDLRPPAGPRLLLARARFAILFVAMTPLLLDVSRETQTKIREATESVDNFAKAKETLEPFGMTVVEAKVEEFRKVAQQKIWPAYKSQYGALWDEIEGFKV